VNSLTEVAKVTDGLLQAEKKMLVNHLLFEVADK
jgi:hypothetical protein